jgi:hypothetical protein
VQRAERLATHDRCFGDSGGITRAVAVERDEGVNGWLQTLGSFEHIV